MQRVINYISNVRSRTEEEKQRAVIFWTIVFIVIIFFIWLISFSLSLSNDRAEDLRLKAEAERLATAKLEASLSSASSTEEETFKGLIPELVDFTKDGVDNIVNGFWVVGNLIHK